MAYAPNRRRSASDADGDDWNAVERSVPSHPGHELGVNRSGVASISSWLRPLAARHEIDTAPLTGAGSKPMKVVVLCGGQGTRLREETEFRPKPLVEVGGRPVLWHIMKHFAHYGLRDFVLCLGYRGNMIKEYFLDYEAMNSDFTISLGTQHSLDRVQYHDSHEEQDFQVTLTSTGLDTMTGGRVKRAERFVKDPTFMVTYGDGLSDVDLGKLLAYHKSHGKLATVTTVRPTSRYGALDCAADGHVTRFREKPQIDDWASAGFFVFSRRIFDYLDGDDCILERGPMERLAGEGELMAYKHEGFFFAMDTYREFVLLNEMWSRGEAPWNVRGSR